MLTKLNSSGFEREPNSPSSQSPANSNIYLPISRLAVRREQPPLGADKLWLWDVTEIQEQQLKAYEDP